eukprot:gene42829-52332_t
MSFSLSKKLSLKVDDKKDNKKETENNKKKGLVSRQNPLLLAKTEDYVDDIGLYEPKITRDDRLKYFDFLLAHGKQWKIKKKKGGNQETALFENEELNYPQKIVKLFKVLCSNRWDHLYLDCLLLFLILVVFFLDGWAALIGMDALQDSILTYPLIGMIVCAGTPCMGIVYYTHYCNDLVLFLASVNFNHWAFPACLIAQYIEFFYYGGRDRRDLASNLRNDRVMHNKRPILSRLAKIAQSATYLLGMLRGRAHARVGADSEQDEEEGSQDTGESSKDEEAKGQDAANNAKPVATKPKPTPAPAATPAASDEAKDVESLDSFERELRGEAEAEMVEWT